MSNPNILSIDLSFDGLTKELTSKPAAAKKELTPFPHKFAYEEIQGAKYLTVGMPFPQEFPEVMEKSDGTVVGTTTAVEGTIKLNGEDKIARVVFYKYAELKNAFFNMPEGAIDNAEDLSKSTELFIPLADGWLVTAMKTGRAKNPTPRQRRTLTCRIGEVAVKFMIMDMPVNGAATTTTKKTEVSSAQVASVKALLRG